MELKWASKALSDLVRLHDFLAPVNSQAAERVMVGNYELRYEIHESIIYVLRLWHTREGR
ncbi:type II toxin-antitoxin system RelE/ParE family toxin [Mesorhizobium sp. M0217]|uniref:type II toxin-antitoxin system RelE/ParE family toxin n=1 Tax=unclassified Mesorhizobium TaxID=325217 RepID=UPI003337930C